VGEGKSKKTTAMGFENLKKKRCGEIHAAPSKVRKTESRGGKSAPRSRGASRRKKKRGEKFLLAKGWGGGGDRRGVHGRE